MIRRGPALLLLLAAVPACPPFTEPAAVVVPIASALPAVATARPEARGCPADMRVHPASDGPLDDRTTARFLLEARVDALTQLPASVYPQGFDPKASLDYRPPEDGKPLPARLLPRDLAIKLGAADSDAPITVYRDAGGPACVAKPGGHHAALRADGLHQPYVEILRKLEGCAPHPAEKSVILARSASPLEGCQYHVAKDIARDRVQFPEGPLQPPLRHEGIGSSPFDVTPFGPPGSCISPSCLVSFTIRGVELPGGQGLFSVSVSHARPTYGEDACVMYANSKCTYAMGSVVRASAGAAPERFTDEKLEGVLADGGGARFAITTFHKDRVGTTVFRVDEGKPKELRRFPGDTPHPEDSAFERYSDCPYCGP